MNMKLPPPPISKFKVTIGITRQGFKLGIYGPEGIGKSSLAALCKGAVFADIEDSMSDLNVARVNGVTNWETLREWVKSLNGGIAGIDSVTRAEDWAAQYVITNKKSNDGLKASDSLEDFKYKAGLQFVCDEFNKLLFDIDLARRRGVSFIMVAHMRISRFKNPDDSDFVRHEPRLIDEAKGSNMLRWIQFLDHLAFINMDKAIKSGKASGSGTRSIYLDTHPTRLCKARGIDNSVIDYTEGNDELLKRLGTQ